MAYEIVDEAGNLVRLPQIMGDPASGQGVGLFDPDSFLTQMFPELDGGVDPTAADSQGFDLASLFGDDSGQQELDNLLGILSLLDRRRSGGTPGLGAGALELMAPPGLEFNPGFDPGGLADILMGIVSGKGTQAAMGEGMIPDALRRPMIVDPSMVTGAPAQAPTIEQDIIQARDLLNILQGRPTAQQTYDQGMASAEQYLSPMRSFASRVLGQGVG